MGKKKIWQLPQTTDPLGTDLLVVETDPTGAKVTKASTINNIRIDRLKEGEDNMNLNVNTTRHGLCPKAPNDTTKFLRGDASWAVPSGPFSSQNVVTGSRALETVYQNTTGKVMMIAVTVTMTSGWAYAYTDSNASPSTIVAGVSWNSAGLELVFIVLPGNYYKVTGTASLNYWVEWY